MYVTGISIEIQITANVNNTVIREYTVDVCWIVREEKQSEIFQRQLTSEIEKHAMNSVSLKHLNVF